VNPMMRWSRSLQRSANKPPNPVEKKVASDKRTGTMRIV
jgi:hypothetical protein